jgi:hypothetical protein
LQTLKRHEVQIVDVVVVVAFFETLKRIALCCARAASEQAAISLANKAPACAPFT